MSRRLVILGLLLAAVAPVLAGPSPPAYYFTARRTTSSGSSAVIRDTSGVIWAYPADPDTAGKGKACAYVGGPYSRWKFMPDSTYTYTFYETGGDPDSVITDMETIALWGPSIATASDRLGVERSIDVPDSVFASYVWPYDDGITIELGGHVHTDSMTVDTLLSTGALSVSGTAIVGSLESEGGVTATTFVDADSVHAAAALLGDSLRVGDSGASDGVRIKGGLTVTGSTALATTRTSGTLTVGDGTGTDSLTVMGDIRARGGEIVAGTAGRVGSVVISDGSANVTSLSGAAWGSDVTLNVPFFFADFRLTGTVRSAYYVAGIDSSWIAMPAKSGWYDPTGSPVEDPPGGSAASMVTRPYHAYTKADSVIVLSHTCCVSDTLTHLFLFIGKKNLWRRGS